jgi:hypothetical protein
MTDAQPKPRADGTSHWDAYLADVEARENAEREAASTAASAAAQGRLLAQLRDGDA